MGTTVEGGLPVLRDNWGSIEAAFATATANYEYSLSSLIKSYCLCICLRKTSTQNPMVFCAASDENPNMTLCENTCLTIVLS
jgi:hypothetical protein